MRLREIGGVCGVVAILAMATRSPGGNEPATGTTAALNQPPASPEGRAAEIALSKTRGAGSCSASACHGGTTPATNKVLRNEHTTWRTLDPHASAYDTLFTAQSKSILENLGGTTSATKDARCLACHTTYVAASDFSQVDKIRRDGVSCESCHGPSGDWIGAHVRGDWPGKTSKEKEASFGMAATGDLASRVQACAQCHIGAPATGALPARDVDHDLIAAGHPRLTFEFAAYFAKMPKHWSVSETDDEAKPDFPARAWLVGQLVSAKAALELLADRAEHSLPAAIGDGRKTVWPEFSEYGCFSCHHDLTKKRLQSGSTTSGTPSWGSWNHVMLEALAGSNPSPRAQDVLKGLDAVRKRMSRLDSDNRGAADQARALAKSIGDWIDDNESCRKILPADAKAFRDALTKACDIRAEPSWDRATQHFLGLQQLDQAVANLENKPLSKDRIDAREDLRKFLAFPPAYDSPKRIEKEP